jgi:hypothetical protein
MFPLLPLQGLPLFLRHGLPGGVFAVSARACPPAISNSEPVIAVIVRIAISILPPWETNTARHSIGGECRAEAPYGPWVTTAVLPMPLWLIVETL